jgi:uncharacterized protein
VTSDTIAPSERSTVIRHRERGVYDRAAMYSIIDEALNCHVGFSIDGQPYVLPTTHARLGDKLYLHGHMANHMLKTLKSGAPVCVTVTLLDGLVLARSAMHHSMNYRSVVILGRTSEVTAEEEKRNALAALVNHVVQGRSAEVRAPDAQELKATTVLELAIAEASAKVRTGPPIEADADYALTCWAGVLPLHLQAGAPLDDPRLAAGISVPATVANYDRRRHSDSRGESSSD